MKRRQFVTTMVAGAVAMATPITVNLSTASAGLRVHRRTAHSFRELADFASQYATALNGADTVAQREAWVLRLYDGLLRKKNPRRDAVTHRVATWEHEGPAALLKGFMAEHEFRLARPHRHVERLPGVDHARVDVLLNRMTQVERMFQALGQRQPTAAEMGQTMTAAAIFAPTSGKTVILPRQSSRLEMTRAHAEMDYSDGPTYSGRGGGTFSDAQANQMAQSFVAEGLTLSQAQLTVMGFGFALATAVGAVAAQGMASIVLSFMAEGTISITVATGLGVTTLSLVGFGLAVMGLVVLTITLVHMTQGTALGSPSGSTSVGTPANGPSQTAVPEGVVTVGEISVVDVGPADTSGQSGAPAGGTSGADGSGASGPGGDAAW